VPSLAILLSAVLVLSCGQTDRITEADDRYTHATTVGMSKTFDCEVTVDLFTELRTTAEQISQNLHSHS